MQESFITNCVDKVTQDELKFKGLVEILFSMLRILFCDLLQEILQRADERIHANRDSSRYEYKYKSEKTVVTILGEVTYERRYYLDHSQNTGVFLLDKKLGIEKKVGGHLACLAVNWALGDTFRTVRDKLADLYGEQVLSHENIRQLTYEAIGKFKVSKQMEGENEKTAPEVLIIEADEIYPGAQEEAKNKHEFKVAMAHTGWEPVSGYSSQTRFALSEAHYYCGVMPGEEFWERFSRELYEKFDLSRTTVVINGDGAAWIRGGRDYFNEVMYSYNTYHVAKILKRAISYDSELRAQIEELAAKGAVEDLEKVVEAIRQKAEREGDSYHAHQAEAGLEFIARNRRYIRNYKDRLQERGVETKYLRNLGASEATACQFSRRIKRGRSWRKENLNLMGTGLIGVFEGDWQYQGRLSFVEEEDLIKELEQGAGHLTDKPRTSQGYAKGHFPATDNSNNQLSRTLRDISRFSAAI